MLLITLNITIMIEMKYLYSKVAEKEGAGFVEAFFDVFPVNEILRRFQFRLVVVENDADNFN